MGNGKQCFALEEFGRAHLQLFIKPLDDIVMKPVRMKVDTGADLTTMSKSELYDLGFNYDWIEKNALTGDAHNLTTAAGDTEVVGVVQLPLLNLLGYEAHHWPIRIILSPQRDFRNLLGRDLLAGFDFAFRNSVRTFEITRVTPFVPLFKFAPGQRVLEVGA